MTRIAVHYKPSFLRQFKKLEPVLQDEAREKIELFTKTRNHAQLRVHKLTGRLAGYMSFSVNYRYRVVFKHVSKNTVALLAIGDHDVYK